MKSNQDLKSHKQYAHIPTVTRIKLIKLVLERSASIAKAASKLSLSLSTAKLIVKRFKTTGTIFQKRNEATQIIHIAEEAPDSESVRALLSGNAQNNRSHPPLEECPLINQAQPEAATSSPAQIFYFPAYYQFYNNGPFLFWQCL